MSAQPTAPPDGQQVSTLPANLILGTAGHIDHGKTTLVKALTGTDTDRLPEERQRGMTIELGFASLAIDRFRFGIVDVPGHERFIRTMVAGATGIDIALIIVAADDSVMPQTREHVEILQLLGISRAVVALTKIDMVDRDMVELVSEDVKGLLAETTLADAPIRPVSSATGEGLSELRQALLEAARLLQTSSPASPFRMPVDRVFTVQGRGTVVTGSGLRGVVKSGDNLQVWPGGQICRVRDLQAHGDQKDCLGRGQRVALNLTGISRENLERGVELATPDYLCEARMIDCNIRALASNSRAIKTTQKLRLCIGTAEVPARIVLMDARTLDPGASAFAQLRCGTPITATHGQRFIIRDENATRTIGGGRVLRPNASRRRLSIESHMNRLEKLDSGSEADRLAEVLRDAGMNAVENLPLCARAGVELEELPSLLEQLKQTKKWVPLADTGKYVVPEAIKDIADRIHRWLERFHRQNPELPGRHVDSVLGRLERMTSKALARPILASIKKTLKLKQLGSFVCLPAFAPKLSGADEKFLQTMIEAIREGGFQPPALEAIPGGAQVDRKRRERLATLAAALGELVPIAPKMYLHRDSENALREKVAGLIEANGQATVADIREALDSSRKFVVPFVEYLDRVGFTKRVGDHRELV